MNINRLTLIVILSVVCLVTFACGAGQIPTPTLTPLPTDTPLPPTATLTPTAIPTNTPLPPTPTVEAIQGSKEPVTIGDFELSISLVDLSDSGYHGLAPANLTADQTVLTVQVVLNSGDLDKLSQLTLWVTDEGGHRTDSGTTLMAESKKQVTWLFPVAKTSHSFVLHFPSGEAIDLAPLLP